MLHRFFTHTQEIAVIGHSDPEEFIEVAAIDRKEFDSFEQWDIRVFGLLQDSVIKSQPADIPVNKAIGFQIAILCHFYSFRAGNPLV
jgi:hypothetical protein